jgi:hypothetical protein
MPERRDISELTDIPNIGPAISRTLKNGGIRRPSELIGKDPYTLYEQLCAFLHTRLDPCFLDTLIAAVDYMNGGAPKKWWEFTAGRKAHLEKESYGKQR